jgi:multidrug efflux pump subunit AcrA (membrane-fusion protein)
MKKNLSRRYHPSLEDLEQGISTKVQSTGVVRLQGWIYASAVLLFIILILLMFSLLFVPWQQTSFGMGTVIPFDPSERLQEVHAPVKGLIERWYVVEGDIVKEGDPLAEFKDIDPQLLDRLGQQLTAATAGLKAASIAVQTSMKNLERQKELARKGLKSQRDYELAQLEYQKLLAEEAGKIKELSDIEVKLSRQSSQTLRATRSGQVMRVYYPQGGVVVKQGDTVAALAPTTDRKIVELQVNGNDLPLLDEGRKVRLQFEGWPGIQFSGWPSVAVGTFGGIIHNIDHSDNGKGYFRIFVWPDTQTTPWPDARYLRQGVRVKGWVLLDTVALGFELWRIFNGFPPVVQEQQKKKKESDYLKRFNKQLGKLAK